MSRASADSKRLTGSGVVTTAGVPGWLCGYTVKLGDTADTLVEFKNGGTSGTVKWEDGGDTQTTAGDLFIRYACVPPIYFSTDIWCAFTGTNTVVNVSFVEDIIRE